MRPCLAVRDEALEKLRRGDGAGICAADILHIGDLGADHLVVERVQRKLPNPLAGIDTGIAQTLRQLVVIRKYAGMFKAQCLDDGAGQGRQINNEFGLETALRISERIGQHQTAFRVGVQDFDGLARQGRQHIVGPDGVAARHVLDQADDADGIHFRLALCQRQHHAGDGSRPAHIAFHAHHAAAGLERQTAGIKAHALADKSDGRALLFGAAAIPLHHH